MYYDYGNNVTYEDNSVYVNGDSAGTSEEYYNQAAGLATTGARSESSPDADWLPLGVFALTKPDQEKSDISLQLAINKQGIIRGNYTDSATEKNQVIQGSADKQTQKVAFTIGDNTTDIVETGLYNLTKDEAPRSCIMARTAPNNCCWFDCITRTHLRRQSLDDVWRDSGDETKRNIKHKTEIHGWENNSARS